MKGKKKIVIALLAAGSALLLGLIAVNLIVCGSARSRIRTIAAAAPAQAVLILGARVYPDGRVSHIVEDRIAAAVDLYRAGKAGKILVTGDHGTKYYDEVNTIRKKLLAAGVPAEDIFLDHAGFSTYDSLYRARAVFRADSLVIVTQRFHLERALFLAGQFGIRAQGVAADRRVYRDAAFYELRELFARAQAFCDAVVFRPRPKYLGKEIPISGDGRESWD